MRVIAGSCRGRPLRAPAGSATRPTGDRVREAVFDVLGSLTDLEGAAVVDLFAGSGALGIEALSRGAARAVFVERRPDALAAIRSNLAALGLEGRARVVRADALGWVAAPRGTPPGPFDLAFCDPPYDFEAWEALLGPLPAALAVLESSREPDPPPGWEVVRRKRYGGTLVTVVRRPRGVAAGVESPSSS
ncbi:MAG: 16S rRNA (guanine(966)-N(2))-methyltransferase RsmD [Acidobacteriota bacterium]|nr:16S rRNA (guanine(966)-N(2))-methyltransferase RsmD [Acidobacteriota bacterium]